MPFALATAFSKLLVILFPKIPHPVFDVFDRNVAFLWFSAGNQLFVKEAVELMSDRAKSLAVTEDILTANPNLNGIFAPNESSSIGASQAVKMRGLGGKVKIVAFDASSSLIVDLQEGVIDSLVVQNPYAMMDCDTTGVEPDIALIKYKKLVGGGLLKIVNQTVPEALRRLKYNEAQINDIIKYIDENETIEGAPQLKEEHLPVFDCAFKPLKGVRSIHYMQGVGKSSLKRSLRSRRAIRASSSAYREALRVEA